MKNRTSQMAWGICPKMDFKFVPNIEVFLEYCRAQQNLSENTILGYRQDLRAFAKFISNEAKTRIDSNCILDYMDDLRNRQVLAPATVRRRIVCLKKFFKWAFKFDQNAPNPFEGLEIDLKVPKRLPRPIDREILRQLFGCFPRQFSCTSPFKEYENNTVFSSEFVTLLAIRLLTATGLRVGELTHIKLKNLSPDCSRIRVVGKGNRERSVYVTNLRLLTDLKRYCEKRQDADQPDAFLFQNVRGVRLSEAAFRKRLKCLSAGLALPETLTPHRFRHSAATLLIEEGIDIRIVQRLLGHASIATTEIYTRVSDNSLIQAISRADTLGQIDP
ncbi:tyrosine-type recombinase/integrase [uncultured Cohaesibacter sp.]|uniref:tyrosine-type recombinase/integrase n=1 Tax=uncultured Cohaesibacter sp. TaxID=1002546 RepID=UPI002AA6B69C|nr:tyrosine-type recombinase/integrase [uncultured Cohaesibacter sp.]